MTETACIAIDWGTSNLRASLLNSKGEVLDKRRKNLGILEVKDGTFAAELDNICGEWLTDHQNIPVLMSGMVGSKQGWVETPYLPAPCDLKALINAMTIVPNTNDTVHIMPGIRAYSKSGIPEIMRGEETQIGGVIIRHGVKDGIFCIPGTHSKWVLVDNGQIETFATFMTGELFSVMKKHSILGRLMKKVDNFDPEAFKNGLARANDPGGILHHLFSVRTLGILEKMETTSLASFLSGQLIGSELRGVQELYGKLDQVNLLSSGTISAPYSLACATANIKLTNWDAEEATLAGLWAAAEKIR